MQTEVGSHLLESCGTIWSNDSVHSSAPKAWVQVPLHESCHTTGKSKHTPANNRLRCICVAVIVDHLCQVCTGSQNYSEAK